MQGMTDGFEHAGRKYTWWAGHADHEGEWCVHCRHERYGLTLYLDDEPSREDAEKVAQGLAPLVESIETDKYTT